jgi:hypothetical protein
LDLQSRESDDATETLYRIDDWDDWNAWLLPSTTQKNKVHHLVGLVVVVIVETNSLEY